MKRAFLVVAGLLLAALVVVLALGYAPDRAVESLLARWAPPPSAFLTVKGQRVHYRDEGPRDDPLPLVLIHGTSASLHTWEGWVDQLKGRRRVISFDLPGFGLTGPNAAGDYQSATYARFILDLMDELKVQRFVVAGNSLGGEVAWRTALVAPARVERLILVDASGYALEPRSIPIGFKIARIPVLNRLGEILLPRSLVEASVRKVYGDPSRVTPALVDRYYELTLREGNRQALGQRFRQMAPGADASRIAELKLPTLILWGGRDQLIPPDAAKRFVADIAGSRLVTFDDLGHVPHEEDPARSVAPVLQFLGSNP
jgi:pimeloyl-ACP methyl ester carboxylesterase